MLPFLHHNIGAQEFLIYGNTWREGVGSLLEGLPARMKGCPDAEACHEQHNGDRNDGRYEHPSREVAEGHPKALYDKKE